MNRRTTRRWLSGAMVGLMGVAVVAAVRPLLLILGTLIVKGAGSITPAFFLPRDRGEYDWATLNTYLADQVPDGSNGALRGTGSGFFAGNQEALFGFLQDDCQK